MYALHLDFLVCLCDVVHWHPMYESLEIFGDLSARGHQSHILHIFRPILTRRHYKAAIAYYSPVSHGVVSLTWQVWQHYIALDVELSSFFY